jgi:ATP-dependent Clp protease ATP-binding subunit ClpA
MDSGRITPTRLELLRGLPSYLAERIRGQPEALEVICSVLIRGELGLANPRRPKGSLLLIGPTGVGKTETTIVFTSYLFGGEKPIRFDLSEYQLQKSVEKLIGGDRHDAGLLGRALAGKKNGTVLFDELEKAHPLLLDLFLQILEDGRITLATGATLDLTGFYIVFTSNIGSREVVGMASPPFASVKRTVLMRAQQELRPELYGRITEKVVFARLDYGTQRAVCENVIAAERDRLALLGHRCEVAPDALEFAIREGHSTKFGARPMRGVVERRLQDAIAADILAGGSGSGLIGVRAAQDRLSLSRSDSPPESSRHV